MRTGPAAPCLLSLFALLLPGRAAAHGLEIGAILGARLFSESNELGRLDLDPRAPGNAPLHTGLVGLAFAYLPHPRVALEAEAALLPGTTVDGRALLLTLAYRGHAIFHILTGRFRPFILAGGGATSLLHTSDPNHIGVDTDPLLHGGAGLKIDLGRSFTLRLDGRVLFPPRIEDNLVTVEGEVLIGLAGRIRLSRRPASRREIAPSRRMRPALAPRPAPPLRVEPPREQEPARPPDTDGDGILDADDRCASEKETRNGYEDGDGCPDEIPQALAARLGTVRGIVFQPGKHLLRKPALKVLDDLARVLGEHPSVRLLISAYTETAGADEANRALAERRAGIVKLYLSEKGVDAARLGTEPAAPPDKRPGPARDPRNDFVGLKLLIE